MDLKVHFASGATIDLHHKWLGFGTKQRLDFYEVLAVLLGNRVSLAEGIEKIFEMASRAGRSSGSYAICLDALVGELEAGLTFDRAIAPLVPLAEAQLIRAGIKTGDLEGALAECISNLERGTEITGSILVAALFPAVMAFGIYHIFGVFSKKVIPPFERFMSTEEWTGAASLMASMIEVFRAAGPAIAIGLIGLVALTIVSMPLDWGRLNRLRVFLDTHVPPWSIYRMVAGTTFLRTLASQIRAGQRLDMILQEMTAATSPWLSIRLGAISDGLAAGLPLGAALHGTGFQFPDRRAIEILKVLSESDGFEAALQKFAARWETTTVKRVVAASKVAVYGSTLVVGMVAGTLFLGIQELQDQVAAKAGNIGSKY